MITDLFISALRRLLPNHKAIIDQSRTINVNVTVHKEFHLQMPPAHDHRQLALSNEEAN